MLVSGSNSIGENRMKPILIRGGVDLFKHYAPRDSLKKDSFGGNSGNLMFFNGTMNALTTSRVRCISAFYKMIWTDVEVDEINQTCSAFVLPLADAFRATLSGSLMRIQIL